MNMFFFFNHQLKMKQDKEKEEVQQEHSKQMEKLRKEIDKVENNTPNFM